MMGLYATPQVGRWAADDAEGRQLQELARLRDAGFLNDEELAREKQRILADRPAGTSAKRQGSRVDV